MSKNFKPYPYAFFEEKVVPIEEAQISIMTNALHYGTGIFGGIKAFKTDAGVAIFRLDDHIARMKQSVQALGFHYNFDNVLVKKAILNTAQKNSPKTTAYIRPLIYRSDTNISPDIAGDYELAVYMLDMPAYFQSPNGLRVDISDWQRNSNKSIPPRTKATGGYINSALAISEAKAKGFDSSIMLDKDGFVSEGAVMNLFLVKDSQLITPSIDSDILEGITRRTVLEIAEELGIKVAERKVSRDELLQADEVFFSGTATDITWCSQIENTIISKNIGPLTKKIAEEFSGLPQTRPELFTKI